ncbi:MAG: aspartate 1-decarboxylase [Hyphomonadaceae bacterium]
MRWVLRSKLHNGRTTDANVNYVGSIEIDEDLVDAVGLCAGEKVLVVSNTSGARLETYVIAGRRGSGVISMNGAAAKLIGVDEQVIIMGFELAEGPLEAKVVLLDAQNRIAEWLHGEHNSEAKGAR